MTVVDTIIAPRWIATVDAQDRVLHEYAVAVGNGRITDVLPLTIAQQRYPNVPQIKRPQGLLIPGLINAHSHLAMCLMRGIADDLPLKTWLTEHIWPIENRWVSPEFIEHGSLLGCVELIRSGVTCFNDMYFFPELTAAVAAKAGLRAVVGLVVLDFPTVWGQGPDEYIAKGLSLHDQYRSHPQIHTALAPHAPYSVSEEPLKRIRTLAEELQIPIHTHLHETAQEVADSQAAYQQSPVQRWAELGLLSPLLAAAHMVHLTEAEIELVATSGVNVLHCPESNLKLASGMCQVHDLLTAGVNVALGTDGAASNNDLDMLGEMRTAALLAKAVARDAAAVPARTALRMATINGAKALGLEEQIGSIEIGKSADLVLVDFNDPLMLPLYDPISQLIYAANRSQISDVWVDGQQLLRERNLTRLDVAASIAHAHHWQARLSEPDCT